MRVIEFFSGIGGMHFALKGIIGIVLKTFLDGTR